jgi:hypothetical protein
MTFTYTKMSEDFLSSKTWCFWLTDNRIVLSNYYESSRKTKRHKMQIDRRYDRLMYRDSTIQLKDVPLPSEVFEDIKRQIVDSLVFTSDCYGKALI